MAVNETYQKASISLNSGEFFPILSIEPLTTAVKA